MRIPHIYFIMNKISDLTDYAALNLPKSIAELRKHVSMLVIDDNDFAPEKFLRLNGYQIHHKTDIDNIKDFYAQVGSRVPETLYDELAALEARLNAAK